MIGTLLSINAALAATGAMLLRLEQGDELIRRENNRMVPVANAEDWPQFRGPTGLDPVRKTWTKMNSSSTWPSYDCGEISRTQPMRPIQ
jgi:hypothetical protein